MLKGLKSSSDQSQAYSLSNTDNYKPVLSYSLNEILDKYVLVIINYMKLISEKIYIKKHNYYKFIFIRGLDTVTSVFKMLLFFTKNVELTYYHSQKAFYFYVEFIEQISNDQNTFLQLSSREACMFVYKKTIFEINNDFRKNMEEISATDKNLFSMIDKYLIIYKNTSNFGIYHSEFDFNDRTTFIHNYCDKLKQLCDQINHNLGNDYLECIYLFVNHLLDKPISITNLFLSFHLFLKKMTSNKTFPYSNLHKCIKEKITRPELYKITDTLLSTPKLLVEWIVE